MSKKKYLLLLLIPVILIAAFIVVNYKPLSLAVEYYNTNYYNEDGTVIFDYTSKEIANNISNNNYQQYMLDITDYYITSDFVYVILNKLGLLDAYINGIRSKLYLQFLFINIIQHKEPINKNEKFAEMLKYYPIKDMENFPELTLNFITKIFNYYNDISFPLLTGVIFEGAVADSNALAYVFITQQNCNQKEYYFEKFLYNPYRYLKQIYLEQIPMDTVDNAKLSELKVAIENMSTYIENNIQEINNACGYSK